MQLTRRHILAALSVLSGEIVAATGRASAARYYAGPVSDHFDGVRFFDPSGMPPKTFADTLRAVMSLTSRSRWPASDPSPYADQPPVRVHGSRWRIAFVGHASLLLQTAGLNILFDPVWSYRASPLSFAGPKRANQPGIAFEMLPPIDVVLVSHCHYDHLDIATLSRLAVTHRPRVITPLGNDTIFRNHDPAIRAEAYDWGDRVTLAPGLAVSLTPMRHSSARGLLDRNMALWAAFIVETPAGRIYHVGDSSYGDGRYFRRAREQNGPFRLAILPIGAYEPHWFWRDQHMNPADSVQALLDCGAEFALAHHFGTFQLTNEGIDDPPQALQAAMQAHELSEHRFRVLKPGQVWEL
jgi:L-ascorbate metabolism protein UlaG (beta-lactamase superfamily)